MISVVTQNNKNALSILVLELQPESNFMWRFFILKKVKINPPDFRVLQKYNNFKKNSPLFCKFFEMSASYTIKSKKFHTANKISPN